MVAARGAASSLRWSPDGSRLAFVSNRGTHSFIGLSPWRRANCVYLDPFRSIADSSPVWSPDGARIAFAREFAAPRPQMFAPDAPPTSHGRSALSTCRPAPPGRCGRPTRYGSVPQPIDAENQILRAPAIACVPLEKDGWLHLQRAGRGRSRGANHAWRRRGGYATLTPIARA